MNTIITYTHKFAAIFILLLMAATFSSRAEAVIIGGYEFGLVTTDGIYSVQAGQVLTGYVVSSLAILNNAEATAGLDDLGFLTKLLQLGSAPTSSLDACNKIAFCAYRLSDEAPQGKHGETLRYALYFDSAGNIFRADLKDDDTSLDSSAIYLLYAKPVETSVDTPEPSLSLLLGGGLMGLGYLAYRRKGR